MSAPADDRAVADGPPYLEHPTEPAVRARARERARRAVSDAHAAARWNIAPSDLDALADLVLTVAWTEFTVATIAWDEHSAAPAAPASVPAAKARSARSRPAPAAARTSAA